MTIIANDAWPFNSGIDEAIDDGTTSTTGTTGTATSGGTWTSLPIPISTGGTVTAPTSTGNGSTVTSTGNGATWVITGSSSTATGAIGQIAGQLQGISTQKQKIVKDQMRYVIMKNDGSTLTLEEQDTVTPMEMIGLSKFIMLVSCATTLVYSQSSSSYNIQINWSKVVENLGIERHFVLQPNSALKSTAPNVFDITLYDPT